LSAFVGYQSLSGWKQARTLLWLQPATDHIARGMAFVQQGAATEAIAEYDQALELTPPGQSARARVYACRAMAWAMRGDSVKAMADAESAVRANPSMACGYVVRGLFHGRLGHYAAAEADLLQSLAIDRHDPGAMNLLAWLWATCPNPQFRQGKQAVQYATQACQSTGWKEPSYLGTLAAAMAEAGNFDAAIHMQEKALENTAYQRQEGQRAYERIRLYRAGTPYREQPA
jgi:tetratricopeptide (TPR) repeat protein